MSIHPRPDPALRNPALMDRGLAVSCGLKHDLGTDEVVCSDKAGSRVAPAGPSGAVHGRLDNLQGAIKRRFLACAR
jgi:hypothetical protein